MSDIPEADSQDQRRVTNGEEDEEDEARRPRHDVAEADAQEQAADVRHVGHRPATRSAEVPDADAAEQAQEVPDDEDDID